MTTVGAMWAVMRRDLTLGFRTRREIANPLMFFVIVVSLFPLAIGADSKMIESVAPGIVWVTALLAGLMSLEGVFRGDFEDGALDVLLMSPHPLPILTLGKVLAHWLLIGFPLVLLAPMLGAFLGLEGSALSALFWSLLLGTPVLSLVGSVGVALTVALRRGGILLSLLVLPLYVPVLIFGAGAVSAAAEGFAYSAQLWMLGGLLVLALTLTPLGIAAALRITTD